MLSFLTSHLICSVDTISNSVLNDTSHFEHFYKSIGIIDTNSNVSSFVNLNTEAFVALIHEMADKYWTSLTTQGLGVSQLDDIVILFAVCRFILLSIRYNIITAVLISAISLASAYLWYNGFIKTVMTYEKALLRSTVTFRLGVDSIEMKKILKGKFAASKRDYRVTNPIGVLSYALAKGTVINFHRIDPISMIVSRISHDDISDSFRHSLHSWYYYITLKTIPDTLALIGQFSRYITSVGSYTYITRVNKRYCPYFIRWHWTHLIMLSLFESYFHGISFRLIDYTYVVLYPKLYLALDQNLMQIAKAVDTEIKLCEAGSSALIIIHLSCYIYGLLHAVSGQYFYLVFLTENAELHIGKRTPSSIYSGGLTAWQDPAERSVPEYRKLWYGWFGRGTKSPNLLGLIIKRFIYKPILSLIRKLFGFIKR